MSVAVIIRAARDADIPAIASVYGHHVLHGLASFETEAPGAQEMATRRAEILARNFPYLVAELDGAVAGYAYANHYRTRFAYRFSVEDSIYVDPACAGRGVGHKLLAELIAECGKRGFRQMIAVIGDSGNFPSIRLHQACGFTLTGSFKSIGFKHGRWVDSVLMQRALGKGDSSLPG
jgi:L-amino acid N-acyltransferase YncA